MIPDFDADGNLPPGIHQATWEEFHLRFGVSETRKKLLEDLAAALHSLQAAGCRLVYIDGSFVTGKPNPGDYDLCWSIESVIPERLDPVLLDFSPSGRRAMKAHWYPFIDPA